MYTIIPEQLPLLTNVGLLVPLFLVDTVIPRFFYTLICCTYLVSFLFWQDPIVFRYSIVHKMHTLLSRVTISSFIIYKFFFYTANNGLFFFHLACMMFCFLFSQYYSEQQWCCDYHLFWHMGAHLFASRCIYLALI